jgi:uracil-DNA glycosylase
MTVPASGPRNAKLAVVGMAPADEEIRLGIPFMGPSGNILNTALRRLGVERSEVFVTNVSNEPLPANSPSLFSLPRDEHLAHIARLKQELLDVRPNCIFVLGDEPMRIICGLEGIMKWRGSIVPSVLVPDQKCVVSLHPAAIIRGAMWKWEAVFRHVDLKRAIEESALPRILLPTRNFIIRPTLGMVLSYIETCKKQEWLSFDYETLGDMRMACVGIGYNENEAMCIPFLNESGKHYWTESEESTVMRALADLLESDVPKIGQNLSFEWIVSMAHRIYPRNIGIDTMLLHHCLYPDFGGTDDFFDKKRNEGKPGHSLRFINSQYTRTPFYKDDRKIWASGLGSIESFWRYNAMDVMVTFEAAMKMLSEARDRNLWEFYKRFYNRPFPHTVRVEWQGVLIDKQKREQAHIETSEELTRMAGELHKLIGHPLNIWSTTQMKNLLYQELGYAPRVHRKRGHITADRATLEYLAIKNKDPRLELIIEMRKLADMRSDVLESKLGTDGRMHTHYKLGGTDGARWSSTKSILGSGTNLQNIPRKGIARHLFLPN